MLAGSTLFGAGCASMGPPQAPSLELPRPPSDLRAVRKGERVVLLWTIPERTNDRQSLRYLGSTRICRSAAPAIAGSAITASATVGSAVKECTTAIGLAPPPAEFENTRKLNAKKLNASFTDLLPSIMEQSDPTGYAEYAVQVQNSAGQAGGISNQVKVPLAPTLPPFGDFAAQVNASGVLIRWHCPANAPRIAEITYVFRIWRRIENSPRETKIADVTATACAESRTTEGAGAETDSFLDQGFEWEQTYLYRGCVVSVLDSPGKPAVEVEGEDTPEVKVFAHDIFPPAIPAGVQAVFSGPGQEPFIDLVWDAVKDADLAGYNIYRHEAGNAAERLNSAPFPSPAYRDTRVASGKTYFYSVSAVDERGNESGRSQEANESVP